MMADWVGVVEEARASGADVAHDVWVVRRDAVAVGRSSLIVAWGSFRQSCTVCPLSLRSWCSNSPACVADGAVTKTTVVVALGGSAKGAAVS